MKFIIGSKSKRKLQIAEKILREFFDPSNDIEIDGYNSQSGVPETPYDKQTFDGARNRAIDARTNVPDQNYYIGLESGLVERYGHIYEEAWCAIIDAKGNEIYGYSSGLKVPDYILKKMDDMRMEHSKVMELLEREHSLIASDTWGNYSGGILSRERGLEEAIRNAVTQIVAPEKSFYRK